MPIAVQQPKKRQEFISEVRDIRAEHAIDFTRTYGDWRDDLIRDGYAVIPVMSQQRAAEYVQRAHDFLESVNLGYKRDDPTTIRQEYLPAISEKGMIQHYGISHEDFVWQIRQEPGVIDVFEKVWGTEDLICSFDAFNCTFPNRKDIAENTPWAHQDQDPDRPGLRCLQGLVNLLPNGPDDGGLIVAKGAHKVSEQYHQEFMDEERVWAWTNEFYGYKDTGLKWLKEKGYEWTKVTAQPGELIVWDSRTPHYNCSPTSDQTRMAVYVCMMPASSATQEELVNKKKLLEEYKGTTHWPQSVQEFVLPCLRNGKPDPHNRSEPFQKPEFTERGFKLTGVPYIKAAQ